MISTCKIVGMFLTLVVSIGLPVALIVWYRRRCGRSSGVVRAFFLGMLGFFVTQICLRLPVLSVLSKVDGYKSFVENHFVFYALILAFTAALFELAGRYGVLRFLQKNGLTYQKGIAAGIGHGGIEAILLVGVSMISTIALAFLFNNGMADVIKSQMLASGVGERAAEEAFSKVSEQLVGQPTLFFYLGGFERVLAIAGHVMMTFVLCHFMMVGRTVKGLSVVLVAHFVMDATAAILGGMSTEYLGNVLTKSTSVFLTYLLLAAYCAVGAVYCFRLYRDNKENIH